MEIVRFYSDDNGVDMLAKYLSEGNLGFSSLESLVSHVMDGLKGVPDPYDIANKRILEMDLRMTNFGLRRLPTLDADDTDGKCSKAYDVVFNPNKATTTIIEHDVVRSELPDTPYEKRLIRKVTLGEVSN